MKNKKEAELIFNILSSQFDKPKSELVFSNHFELLIAVLLSAQCTDRKVNMVTPELFRQYKTPEKLANAKLEDIERLIKSINYYKTKSRHLISMSQTLVNDFGAVVPNTIEKLTTLAGVGRKTAQVVLVEGFKIPAVPVDTHIFRVTNRLGLSNSKNVKTCEADIRSLFETEQLVSLHVMFVLFGRYTCTAKNPKCENCVLRNYCEYVKLDKIKGND